MIRRTFVTAKPWSLFQARRLIKASQACKQIFLAPRSSGLVSPILFFELEHELSGMQVMSGSHNRL
jgi:hypothetical protein